MRRCLTTFHCRLMLGNERKINTCTWFPDEFKGDLPIAIKWISSLATLGVDVFALVGLDIRDHHNACYGLCHT